MQAVRPSSVQAAVGLGDENSELKSLWKSSQQNEFILPFSPGLCASLPAGEREEWGTE